MKPSDYRRVNTEDWANIVEALSFTIAEVKEDDPERAEKLRTIIKEMQNRWK